MNQKIKRICLWSGPRNISTALMYSFAQRSDTVVFDEPLYAHYLANSNARTYHPGSDEILSSMENDGEKVVEMLMGKHAKPIAFFKHMTHHLINLNLDFLSDVTNVILTRDPKDMIPSYARQVAMPTMRDLGYKQHMELIELFDKEKSPYIVLESKTLLDNPERILSKLCEEINIPFKKQMLSWEAGARSEDGCWAKYWYTSVHKSTGFQAYRPKTAAFPEHLLPLLKECQIIYESLKSKSLK